MFMKINVKKIEDTQFTAESFEENRGIMGEDDKVSLALPDASF